ncbi:MAG: DUF1836 domain-containing protein [Clostridia bacterium]|nr:DUF1836 domain-containing protein [Clostridia bacterium]
MDQQIKDSIGEPIRDFRLPRYDEIPSVGLYLEQVTKYISDYLKPLTGVEITSSMISNYIKKKIVSNPVKKQYSQEQIAYLIFIAVVKTVVTIDDIKLMCSVQQKTYPVQVAYDYFCMELENMLQYVFDRKSELDMVGVESSGEKVMLRNSIITVAHKVYLNALLAALREKQQ